MFPLLFPAAGLLQEFVITDTLKVFECDDDLAALRDGATLVLASAQADGRHALAAPTRERISFQPHPKTMTMAGEFEYFAAQVGAGQWAGRAALHAHPAGLQPWRLTRQHPAATHASPSPAAT